MTRLALAAALALSLFATPQAFAASQGDWFASLYTGEGVELRNDERIFTLFALFNALGFDQGPVTRTQPVPKVTYSAARQLVRAKVLGGDPEVRKAADAYFDSHAAPMGRYLSWAVQADAPPFAAGPKSKELADLKGFEQVMAKAWAGWKLDEVMAQVQPEYRKSLKLYLSGVDGPLSKARALLKVPESQEVLLLVNLLDAQDQVRAVKGERGEAFLIAGPSDKPNVEGLLKAFAALTVEPAVARHAAKWSGGAAVLREAQLAGANEQTVADYVTSLISLAAAMKAMDASDAAYDAAAAKGYFGIKDVSKLFEDGKPVESWALDAMQRIETRRPAKK
ncbi:MAG: hypothetical protein IT380_09555 [Myxococcales bacterium]|nr:hypothetical protein [Myxococcales bacterium]